MLTEYGFWDIFSGLFGVFVFIAYLVVLFTIIADLFRDAELKGWAKAIWLFFLVLVPFITALVYVTRSTRQASWRPASASAPASPTNTSTIANDVSGVRDRTRRDRRKAVEIPIDCGRGDDHARRLGRLRIRAVGLVASGGRAAFRCARYSDADGHPHRCVWGDHPRGRRSCSSHWNEHGRSGWTLPGGGIEGAEHPGRGCSAGDLARRRGMRHPWTVCSVSTRWSMPDIEASHGDHAALRDAGHLPGERGGRRAPQRGRRLERRGALVRRSRRWRVSSGSACSTSRCDCTRPSRQTAVPPTPRRRRDQRLAQARERVHVPRGAPTHPRACRRRSGRVGRTARDDGRAVCRAPRGRRRGVGDVADRRGLRRGVVLSMPVHRRVGAISALCRTLPSSTRCASCEFWRRSISGLECVRRSLVVTAVREERETDAAGRCVH